MTEESNEEVLPWFEEIGKDDDVVVSTRIRLARNLANFQFVNKLSKEDSFRTRSLILDAFNKFDKEDFYHPINISDLDFNSLKILKERGYINSSSFVLDDALLFLCKSGNIVTTVNVDDHYRIAGFSSALNIFDLYDSLVSIDKKIQNFVQVAYSNEFGYLTSKVKDCGSGLKVSVLLHLPAVSKEGLLNKIVDEGLKFGIVFSNYVSGGKNKGAALGNFYLVNKIASFNGSEKNHLEVMMNFVNECIDLERKTRNERFENKPTFVRHDVYTSIAEMKYCKFLDYRCGIEMISDLKYAYETGLIKGINKKDFLPLLYRTQQGHLDYVINTSNINFEKDVNSQILRIDRLRSLMFQEAFYNLEIIK